MWFFICFATGALFTFFILFFIGATRPSDPAPEPVPETGVYVEVDCRDCLKLNRVPAARLRDRPLCGQCRNVLAPKRRLVICRVTSMDAILSSDLDRVWNSPPHLWDRVADYLNTPKKSAN